METSQLQLIGLGIGVLLLILTFFLLLHFLFFKKPKLGTAIVRTGHHEARIAVINGIYVIPIIHNMELIDLTIKTVKIERNNDHAILLKDEMYGTMNIHFMLKISRGQNDILMAAQSIGAKNTFNQEHIENIFVPKFNNAIETLAAKFDSTEISQKQNEFREALFQYLGMDHNGYFIDDIVIENLTITRS